MRALRRAGVKIALDDVGFGRSCLESLVLLEPDVVKVDLRWVRGISEQPMMRRSLTRFLKIAASLKTAVVAEGIETREDLATLQRMEVGMGQGYLWGKPAPVESFAV